MADTKDVQEAPRANNAKSVQTDFDVIGLLKSALSHQHSCPDTSGQHSLPKSIEGATQLPKEKVGTSIQEPKEKTKASQFPNELNTAPSGGPEKSVKSPTDAADNAAPKTNREAPTYVDVLSALKDGDSWA